MIKLVLLRHGESFWNKENKFTGWTDVELSEKGISEAKAAGATLKKEGFIFDLAFTSVLKRAIMTLWFVLEETDLYWIPEYKSWRLNERHYGALQGLDKAATALKYGEDQVHIWRRSYTVKPPELSKTDPRYPGNEPQYHDLAEAELPLTESLADTVARFLPYWRETMVPFLKQGKRLIIVAHGNTLRALVKELDQLSDQAVTDLNIPTGIPLVYELDDQLKALKHYYLGDPEAIIQAVKNVAGQGSAKR